MAGYGLVEAVKEATDLKSDYAIAKEVGIGRSNISNYKNTETMPDAITVLKLAELARLTPSQALAKLQGGYASLSLMGVTAIASLALFTSHLYASPLYIMLNRRRMKRPTDSLAQTLPALMY